MFALHWFCRSSLKMQCLGRQQVSHTAKGGTNNASATTIIKSKETDTIKAEVDKKVKEVGAMAYIMQLMEELKEQR